MGDVLVPLICCSMITAGTLYAAAGIADVVRAHRSTAWLRARGVIVDSRIAESTTEGSITYRPEVRYSYRVGERELTGRRIYFGQGISTSDPGFALTYTERYRSGDEVTVYYSPERPIVSVLEPGISKRTFGKPVFGLGIALLGAYGALFFWLFDFQ